MARVDGKRRGSARWWGVLLCTGGLLAACEPLPGAEERAPLEEREARMGLGVSHQGSAEGTEVSPPFGVDKPKLKPRTSASGPSAVAWDGRQFFVVWQDERPGSGGMFAARVKPDGTVLDPAGILLNLDPSVDEGSPSAAFDGKQFVVVWLGATGVHGLHVSTEGRVLRRFTFFSGDEVTGRPPALACNPEL